MTATAVDAPHDPERPFFACELVEADYFDTAAIRHVTEVALPVSRARLFAIFEDAASWTRWPIGISKTEWTSPRPFGVGTTRTVTFANGMSVYERFIVWEGTSKLAFCLYGATSRLLIRFGELYAVEELGEGAGDYEGDAGRAADDL